MSAPNLQTLFDFETQIEEAVKTLLEAQGLSVARSDSPDTLETPRCEVMATVNEQGPHEIMVPTGVIAGRRVYDQMSVTVVVSFIFDPTWEQSPGSLRGKVRAALMFITPAELNAELDYLTVANNSIRQSVGSRSVRAEEGTIETAAQLDFHVFIKASAWPTS